MVKVSKKQVLHIAKLSNLKLRKNEVNKFSKQLSEVIKYFEQLKEVKTSNTNPTRQTTGLKTVLRKDRINNKHTLSKADALSGTEKVHNDYFVVPMVLEERTDY